MLRFFSFLVLTLQLTSCAGFNSQAIENWWNEPQTIAQIEHEYNKFLLTLRPNSSDSGSCIEYAKTETIKLSSEKTITIQRCTKLVTFDQSSLDLIFQDFLKTARLECQPEWIKMKSNWIEGDELRTYSAPPFRGGFGIVLLRGGEIINIYEQSFQ